MVVAPGNIIEHGYVVIRDGLITEVGSGATPPADARVWDLAGKTVYAGFIDAYSRYGLTARDRPRSLRPEKQGHPEALAESGAEKPAGAVSWNPLVTPQHDAASLIETDEKQAEKWRAMGFTAALVVPGRGIFRGSSALADLAGKNGNRSLVPGVSLQHVAFDDGGRDARGQYPDSLMGCIALIRQTLLDADWDRRARQFYREHPAAGERPESDESLAALAGVTKGECPLVFETEDELDLLRVLRIADEFKLRPVLRGNGHEYRMLDPLEKSGATVIVPLAFPETPEVETPEKALDVSLEELEHWQEAPGNPGALAKAGVPFALTTDGLDKPEKTFWPRLRTAVRRGLGEQDALAALTVSPAKLLGIEARYGTLEKGKVANLIITSGDLFTDEHATVLAAWINGEEFDTEKGRQKDYRGTYAVTYADPAVKGPSILKIEGEDALKPKVTAGEGTSLAASVKGEGIILLAPTKIFGDADGTGIVRLNATRNGNGPVTFDGNGQLADGRSFQWSARRTAAFSPVPKPDKDGKPNAENLVTIPAAYPAGAFGRRLDGPELPETLLVQNATVWTEGPAGRLDNADLLVEDGKIKEIGHGLLAPPGAKLIDATGMHVTPGLIDCHSHTAISRGVNEATSAVTCEVRIGDVLDATDIALYRELAGGVTVAHVLHGSANPIGGQDQVIKLRWGSLPEDLKLAGAMPGVKFALGENVKQSNWSNRHSTRYPQTRMGVEEILRDTFLAARDYEKSWDTYRKQPPGTAMPPRRDLRMEAAVEILNRQRIIHIHSYRQDEMLMFVRLAQEMNLTVAAFHHGLEAYKIVDEILKLGVGVSTFSDWWAYKAEAIDAIPQNGAMLDKGGVLTSFNSDSNELARRLNTEAAKAVKYGGLSEEAALALVTINPARQLRLDRQTGSLEAGKDADFVLWNGHPLSTYTRAEQTWVDGRCYFDYSRDQQARKEIASLREALIQKALPERRKEMSNADDKKDDADGKKPDDARQNIPGEFTRMLLHREIHRALEHEGLYQDGQDRHNCSTAGF